MVPPGQPAASRSPWVYSGRCNRRASGPGLILRDPTGRRRQPLPRPGAPAPVPIHPEASPELAARGRIGVISRPGCRHPAAPYAGACTPDLNGQQLSRPSHAASMSDVSWFLGLWSLVPLGGLPGSSPFQVSSLLQLRGPYIWRGSLVCAESRPSGLHAGSSPAQVSSHRQLCRFACPVPRAPIRVRLPVANVWKAAGAAHVQPYGVVCALVRQRRH